MDCCHLVQAIEKAAPQVMGVSLYGDQVAIYGFYCFVIGFVACSVALMVLQVRGTVSHRIVIEYRVTFAIPFVCVFCACARRRRPQSSTSALYVCLAEDPATLQQTRPEEYNKVKLVTFEQYALNL